MTHFDFVWQHVISDPHPSPITGPRLAVTGLVHEFAKFQVWRGCRECRDGRRKGASRALFASGLTSPDQFFVGNTLVQKSGAESHGNGVIWTPMCATAQGTHWKQMTVLGNYSVKQESLNADPLATPQGNY